MRKKAVWELSFGALALLSVVPFWVVVYPPIEDLPQHLAAIRVLHSFHDPNFGFESIFSVDILRTQYLTYYLAAHLLAYLFDVVLANKILLTAVICATPYAMRSLLRSTDSDERLALFVFPLTYNAHLILGFFNFLAAIPMTLYGLSLAIRQRKEPSWTKAIGWSVLALVAFYTHVVPFGFLVFGSALVSLSMDLKATFKRFTMFIPAGLGVLLWMATSPAGHSFQTAALLSKSYTGPQPVFEPWRNALRDTPSWLTDVLWDDIDNTLLMAWGILVVATIVCGLAMPRLRGVRARREINRLDGAQLRARFVLSRFRETAGIAALFRGFRGIGSRRSWPEDGMPIDRFIFRRALRAFFCNLIESPKCRLALLVPVAVAAYFITPTSYDWIWPIAQRFPLLAAIFLIPVLPRPRWYTGAVIYVAIAIVAVVQFYEIGSAFRQFDRKEVADFEDALEVIPQRERVAGLIWQRGSSSVKFSPFIHYVAYHLVNKGGAVMFTFADFPASPYTFLENNRPPRVRPRWEWQPELVDPARDLGWYGYVLARGGPGIIARESDYYRPIYRSSKWSVWKRLK
jgi:hypothetical protein